MQGCWGLLESTPDVVVNEGGAPHEPALEGEEAALPRGAGGEGGEPAELRAAEGGAGAALAQGGEGAGRGGQGGRAAGPRESQARLEAESYSLYTGLYCTLLHSTVLYCTALLCTVLC